LNNSKHEDFYFIKTNVNMNSSFKTPFQTVFAAIILIAVTQTPLFSQTPDTLLTHYNVQQCDSLIQANSTNPDFVILDVRTSSEYNPQHLEGAINRNYYAANFQQLLDALPRNKFYLIHCRSGSRSDATFNIMLGLSFPRVVNMLGGILAWNAAALPTTADFASLLMAVSDTTISIESGGIGVLDTLALTITNRANNTLAFDNVTSLTGTEFTHDFEINTTLEGAEDYTFSIIYQPVDEVNDSVSFLIESNGGDINFYVRALHSETGPAYFTISLPEGWSGISSFMVPVNPNVEAMFEPIENDLIILQNFSGFYWPAEGANSISNWNSHEGYMIKMESEQQLTIAGTLQTDHSFELTAGWNFLPVLNQCNTPTADLFSQISGNLKIVKEIAGHMVYWPQYGIFTLDEIIPGRAYLVFVDDDVWLEFPECDPESVLIRK